MIDAVDLPMASTVYVGLAVSSHLSGTLNTAAFDNVSIANNKAAPSTWPQSNLTYYTSWPACCPNSDNYDPNADTTECTQYNGCTWAGQFSYYPNSVFQASSVARHNIVAMNGGSNGFASGSDWSIYKGKIIRMVQGTHQIDAWVLDSCGDSDCSGCCTENANANGYGHLTDIEESTKNRFGTGSGTVQWYCVDC